MTLTNRKAPNPRDTASRPNSLLLIGWRGEMFGTTQKLFGISKERPLVTQGNNEFLNGNFQESVKTLVIAFNRSIGNPSTNILHYADGFDTQRTPEITVAGDQVANCNHFPAIVAQPF